MDEKKIGQMSFEELAAALKEKMPGVETDEAAASTLLMFLFTCIQL